MLHWQERNAYLPLAENGSRLYFVICDLAKINNMYRYSLASFLNLFNRALSEKQVTECIQPLNSSLKCTVFDWL